MRSKVSSGKRRPSCLGLNVLIIFGPSIYAAILVGTTDGEILMAGMAYEMAHFHRNTLTYYGTLISMG